MDTLKGVKESAKLVRSLQPRQGWKEAAPCCTSVSIQHESPAHKLATWALEQLGKWKTKGIVHAVYLYPHYHALNTTSLHTPSPACSGI